MRGSPSEPAARRPLVIGCGALGRELVELTRRSGLPPMDLTCLPASLHNRPERIPAAVAARIRRARAEGYERIFVAYADCGTGGRLDRVLEAEGVARLEGAHCYEVYAGSAAFAALAEEEPGTFYLTDFLVRSFEALVIRGLGLDRHPQLLPVYFANYRRLVFLAQTDDTALTTAAEVAAARLGLAFERRFTGLGELGSALAANASAEAGLTSRTPEPAMTGSHDFTTNRRRSPLRRDPARDSLTVRQDPAPEGASTRQLELLAPRVLTPRHRSRFGGSQAPTPGLDRGDSLTHDHRRRRGRRAPEAVVTA